MKRIGVDGGGGGVKRQIDALCAEWNRPDSPGCVVGVVQNGRFLHAQGYGSANLEYATPLTPQSVFRMASVSKQFTATCIGLLVEAGRLGLDDAVCDWVPELPRWETAVSLRHLLHHTSGWPDYLDLMEQRGMTEHHYYTAADVLTLLSQQDTPAYPPGTDYVYSNTGYFLLAEIIQRTSGQTLAQFAHRHIFAPLGMHNTHFHDDHTRLVPNRAVGYGREGEENGRFYTSMTTLDIVGDGGLFTTLEDLLLWDQNFYHNQLGNGRLNLIKWLYTPGTLANGQPIEYAAGLIVGRHAHHLCIRHSGSFVGYRTQMMRFPQQQLTIICLANLATINATQLCEQVADLLLETR
ncbi:MAG: beta-lactamase family protein [Anaerolineales bacterium]|nr:beta-lactamase family protein [Anaerolineales bacterium]